AEADKEAASADNDASGETPAAGAVPSAVPTFDVVRVEPDGQAVIAGQAEAGSRVELLDGQAVVASGEANSRGEWALVLDEPLTPGTHDLAVRTTSPDKALQMLSDQRVAVSVPEDKAGEPLVVVNVPDRP